MSNLSLKNLCFSIFILSGFTIYAQKIKATEGNIKALSGISEYNLVIEYAEDLQIPNYESESDFLEFQFNKKEAEEKGTGEKFRTEWIENRQRIYKPEFIKAFNTFKLKKRQVRILEDDKVKYTMAIKTFLIYPGYHVEIWYEHTKLEVTLAIFETANPENVLFTSQIIHAEGRGGSTDKERIATAFLNLGTYLSKYLHRKT